MGISKHKQIQDISKSVKELMEQAKKKKQKANTLLKKTDLRIKYVRKRGIITKPAEKLLEEGKKTLASAKELAEYDEAIKQITDARKMLEKLKSQFNEINELTATINKQVAEYTKAGLIIDKNECGLIDIQKDIEAGSYDETISICNGVLKKIAMKKDSYDQATKLLKQARVKIDAAKTFEADTETAELLFNDASAKMELGEYETAWKLVKGCIKSADSSRNEQIAKFKQQAEEQINELQNEIKSLTELGAETKVPSAILKDMEANIENHDFKTAFEYFENCKNAINESRTRHQNAKDRINSAKRIITEAYKFGASIKKAKESYKKAEDALKKYNYQSVDTFTEMAIEDAERSRESHRKLLGQKEHAEDVVNTARMIIKEAEESGIIVTPALEILNQAVTSIANSDFQQASTFGTKAIELCKEINNTFTQAQDNLQKARSAISDSKIILDTSDAEKYLKKSKVSMDQGNYSEVSKYAYKIIENIDFIKGNDKPNLKLKCEEVPEFKTGTWAKCSLELFNESKVHANDVQLSVSEEIESRGLTSISNLKAGEKKNMEIGLRTNELGDVPVNIGISYLNPITNDCLESQEVVWVKTGRSDISTKSDSKVEPQMEKEPEPEGEVKHLSEVEFSRDS